MNCNEAQSRIPDFILGKVEDDVILPFISHVNHCEICMDELEFNYCVTMATKQLNEEAGISDNYIQELQNKLEEEVENYKHRKFAFYRKRFFLILEILAIGILIGLKIFN